MWWYVYVIVNKSSNKTYIGSTGNLEKRLSEHNRGECKSTKAFIPWTLEVCIAVRSQAKVRKLENYFKTGSGNAILKKRIIQEYD